MTLNLLATATGLTFAVIAMIAVLVLGGDTALHVLVVPPLFTALTPVYTMYLFIVFAQHGRQQRERRLSIEAERDRAAWEALSSQLKPHFLFNSLNTVEHLIDFDTEKAKFGVRQLAGIYRQILENSKKTLVPLTEELQLVTYFIEMQRLRFGDRLQFHIQAAEPLQNTNIPPNILLNCIENAIKHGVEAIENSRPILMRVATTAASQIEIVIENEYRDTKTKTASFGFGNADAQKRLHLIYGNSAAFALTKENGLATTRILFPIQGSSHVLS